MVKNGILIANFGTTVAETWEKALEPIAGEVRARCPDIPVYEAVTSPTVRRVLAARGRETLDVSAALERMAADGVEGVTVLPTFVIAGREYERLVLECGRRAEGFCSFRLAPPLLDRPGDLVRAAQAVLERQGPLPEDTALVLMGHGTGHRGDFAYGALDCAFRDLGRQDVFVATIEGGNGIGGLLRRLAACNLRRVVLRPLLMTVGDHVKNDMQGEQPGSWKNRLAAEGFRVSCLPEGLAELPSIRDYILGR